MRLDEERVRDMLEAISAIERKAVDRQGFDADEMVRVWCLHHIEILGEAASKASEALRSRHPSITWRRIEGMRNAVVHGYFSVDWDEVWSVVERDLPPLRKALQLLLAAEGWAA